MFLKEVSYSPGLHPYDKKNRKNIDSEILLSSVLTYLPQRQK